MPNTIQIKRSSATAAPTSLANGELAFSGLASSNSLFIGDVASGSPIRIGGGKYVFLHQANTTQPGALTSNAAVITNGNSFVTAWKTNSLTVGTDATTVAVTSIATTANTTSLGLSTNTELATTWAIKTYVDTAVSTLSSTTLDGLTDVVLTAPANNNILVYDAQAGQWENHTVSGTANEVTATFTGQNLTVGLSANVTIANNLTVTGNISGLANVTVSGTTRLNGSVIVGDAVSDSINVVSKVESSIIPFHSATFDLGNTSFVWSSVHANDGKFGGTVNVGANVNINATSISVGNSTVNSLWTSTSMSVPGTVSAGNTTVTGFVNVSSTGYFGGNVTVIGTTNTGPLNVSGNLTVTGTLTTISADNIVVNDPLIQLANGNVTADLLDIGLFGSYFNGASVKYAGLFRDASDSGAFKLFSGLDPAPTTTVDTANLSFTVATLKAYLNTGAFVSNSSAVTITANSTVSATITANTLSLSTALGVGSGGTGVTTFTAHGVAVANSLGTGLRFAAGTEGQVLQITSGTPAFGGLDGGTF